MQNNNSDQTPLAYIADGVRIPDTTEVHPFAWIGAGVELGKGVVVGPGACIGFNGQNQGGRIQIGDFAFIGSGVNIDSDVEIGAHARIETGSFLGTGTRLWGEARVGPHCVIMGNCEIQEHVLLYANVHVCEYSTLQTHCQLMPGVKLLNDPCPPVGANLQGPTIKECAVIGVNAIIWAGVEIGRDAIIAANSVVKSNVDDYLLMRGSPAKAICDIRRIQIKVDGTWVFPYPWTRHLIEEEDITKPAP